MPKTKPGASGGGSNWGVSGADWSDTGTFVRKPATGWLHKDNDMVDGSYIRYKLSYLGCVKITESMRSLQYQARTLATREAIILLAEHTNKIPPTKKRKVPRQISRLIGEIQSYGAEEVNLCIDVDDLLIKRLNGIEILTHSLTAISFASGGEDTTKNFFGYVAKDPVYNRACHVFYCHDGSAQLVLATVGQAFELRYKRFLSSGSQKVPSSSSSHNNTGQLMSTTPPTPVDHRQLGRGRSTSQRDLPPLPPPTSSSSDHNYSSGDYSEPTELNPPNYMNQKSLRQLPSVPPPMFEVTKLSPSSSRHHGGTLPPPLFPPPPSSSSSVHRTGIYSDVPGFPDASTLEYELDDKQSGGGGDTTLNKRLSYNPYDTMPANQTLPFNLSLEDNTLQEATYDIAEGTEDIHGRVMPPPSARSPLPPPLPPPFTSNTLPFTENTYDLVEPDEIIPLPPPSPPLPSDEQAQQESDYQLITIHQQPSLDRQEDHIDITPVPDEEDDDEDHIYNNTAIIASSTDYDDPIALSTPSINPTTDGVYDDPDIVLTQYNNNNRGGGTDDIDGEAPPPSYGNVIQQEYYNTTGGQVPFDDSIYSTPHETESPEPLPEVDPFAPLSLQLYFHGCISRTDAESYVKQDGEFLVRESTNKPGQFVLTGITSGRPQHLLLIDKSGRVKSKDREFESVPHLVKFFYDRATPLTIGNCEVFLSKPVEHF